MIERNASRIGAFSDTVVIRAGEGRWIYVSGQIGLDPTEDRPLSDFGDEVDRCLKSVADALAECNASLSDVVRITAYLTDLADYAIFADVRSRAFTNALPASTAVQVSGLLAGARVEIDAVAFKRGTLDQETGESDD